MNIIQGLKLLFQYNYDTMIAILAALCKWNYVIGKDNQLPWHLPDDLKCFKELTNNKSVIMGKNTYLSLPEKFRPLPKRNNIVISKTMSEEKGIDVCRSIEKAIITAQTYQKDIFIIGGASIYQQTLPFVDTMYLSKIFRDYEGDTFFPRFDENEWIEKKRRMFNDFDLVTYKRKK